MLHMSVCRRPSGADLAFVEQLLAQIEAEGVPAPAPIEQCAFDSDKAPTLRPIAAYLHSVRAPSLHWRCMLNCEGRPGAGESRLIAPPGRMKVGKAQRS